MSGMNFNFGYGLLNRRNTQLQKHVCGADSGPLEVFLIIHSEPKDAVWGIEATAYVCETMILILSKEVTIHFIRGGDWNNGRS
ncbi:unnamed protein product [Cyprideis torosa]|uniref:Uncharacterized protein n=1 Tax=Cyprideis torosa TaxID=163714 RepID=A0A7R8W548_9CRUS|nr:unnamed protein product [Cyprideis torosa]CAG0884850.1 unnamed protein product [Cyprideis torosa]